MRCIAISLLPPGPAPLADQGSAFGIPTLQSLLRLALPRLGFLGVHSIAHLSQPALDGGLPLSNPGIANPHILFERALLFFLHLHTLRRLQPLSQNHLSPRLFPLGGAAYNHPRSSYQFRI